MSEGNGESDGIGGLILLGAAVLVGAALFGGRGRKKEEEVSVVEDTPEVEEPEPIPKPRVHDVLCEYDGIMRSTTECRENAVKKCAACGVPLCDYHSHDGYCTSHF